MRLLQPQHTMGTSISLLRSWALALCPHRLLLPALPFLSFAALISFSLGFMNLLPIPPLDGGKLVIGSFKRLRAASFRSRSRRL